MLRLKNLLAVLPQVLGEIKSEGSLKIVRTLHTLVRCFPDSIDVIEPLIRWTLTPIVVSVEEEQQVGFLDLKWTSFH